MLPRLHIKRHLFMLPALMLTILFVQFLALDFHVGQGGVFPNTPLKNKAGIGKYLPDWNHNYRQYPKQVDWSNNFINGERAGELFGSSVALNAEGDLIAVSAPRGGADGKNLGQVRIYGYNGTHWTHSSSINGELEGEMFGGRLVSNAKGTILAVGAPIGNVDNMYPGLVRVYHRTPNDDYVQLGETINGKNTGEFFGGALSLNTKGTRIAIGAPYSDRYGKYSGRVCVYELQDKVWVQLGNDIRNDVHSDGTQLGSSISFNADGDRLALGTPFYRGAESNAGQAKVVEWRDGQWQLLGDPVYGNVENDMLGSSVCLSPDGERLAVLTSPMGNDNGQDKTGHVQVFELHDNAWKALGNTIVGSFPGSLTGGYLAFANNGDTLAIGMPFGVNPENNQKSGKIQMYSFVNNLWTLSNTYYGSANADLFGTALSMNSDGNSLAVGAPFNDKNGERSGQVHILTKK